MKRITISIVLLIFPLIAFSQQYLSSDGRVKVAIVKNRYEGPNTIAENGLKKLLFDLNCDLESISTVELTESEDKQYGDWNKAAIESKHIGQLISKYHEDEYFNIGLLKNCSDLLGMLAGFQYLGKKLNPGISNSEFQNEGLAGKKPLRVGLVWIDAHADFNTPETSLSGMLGGMPVAMATGQCLTRLRLKSGLDPALPTKYVTMACLRDVDPLEQELLDRSQCEYISVKDIRNLSDNLDDQIKRLSKITDIIYVHIDMDVLDPNEVSGHPLTAPDGPTSHELAAALQKMFSYPTVSGLGIASMPYGENDPNLTSLKAAYKLIEGALLGVKSRLIK